MSANGSPAVAGGRLRIPLYHVDAFADRPFRGNPAAICPLESWLPDATLQSIAAETWLPLTAFLAAEDGGWRIRWFSPTREVDLCGHATLAAAHVILGTLRPGGASVTFQSRSGPLAVARERGRLVLDFPSRPPVDTDRAEAVAEALRARARQIFRARDYLAVFDTEAEVRALKPDMEAVAALDAFGVIATAPGTESDFVSRFFAPGAGVPEDPVCGSAHCTLTPYWAKRLGRTQLQARQVSERGGMLWCGLDGDRVSIAGEAVTVLEGHLLLPA